ncbi:SNW/SKI-interacting protein-like [Solanum tuberosum]|uniref:Nuclear protein Skip n=1 Tax=Solanum tuberosum TaxID=4113 RepID=M1DJZ7_SOLTU|nr:PREDICTED: SNW/SKI-interacting protein-like [Solanum tuberosum]
MTCMKVGGNTLPVTLDEQGQVRYDSIARQAENAKKIVYCHYNDLVPKFVKDHDEDLEFDVVQEKKKLIEETTRETKAILLQKIGTQQSWDSMEPPKFIKYNPCKQQGSRLIKMVEKAVDPMEPPKFKHKKVPRASGSPPVPVMHSPPRPLTVKDQLDWKIPPCISNWKNPKGYTIPLDKRLAADGSRGIEEVKINDNFPKLAEALYVATEKATEAIAMRSKVLREIILKEKEKKEMELQELARKARAEIAAGLKNDVDDYEGRLRREKMSKERRQERRLMEAKEGAAMKRRKIKTRDGDRDISEKVALGMASTSRGCGETMMYDQRLFNQDKGMDSGFADDDAYNLYDKALFTAKSTLYRPKKDVDSDTYGEQQQEKITHSRPDNAFAGTSERTGPRDRPVEFEADPFGLDQFWTGVKNNMANDGN